MLVAYKGKTYDTTDLTWDELLEKFGLGENHQCIFVCQFLTNDRNYIPIQAKCALTYESLKMIPSNRVSTADLKAKRLRRKKPSNGHDDVATSLSGNEAGQPDRLAALHSTRERDLYPSDGSSLPPHSNGYDDVATSLSGNEAGHPDRLAALNSTRERDLYPSDGSFLPPPSNGHDDVATSLSGNEAGPPDRLAALNSTRERDLYPSDGSFLPPPSNGHDDVATSLSGNSRGEEAGMDYGDKEEADQHINNTTEVT